MRFKHFRMRFHAVLAAVIFATTVLAHGDESTLAPLVNSNTTAVLRVSCQKINLNGLVQVTVKIANKVIDTAIKDPKMAKQAKASLPLLIAGYVSGINSLCDSYKEAGLDDIYLVVTPGGEAASAFFAVPLGSLPKEGVEDIRKGLLSLRNLNLPLPFCFERHGYLFAPIVNPGIEEDRLKEMVRSQFRELHPEPRPDLEEALAEFPDAVAAIVVTGNEESSKMIASSVESLNEEADSSSAGSEDSLSEKMLRLGQEARYGTMVFDQTDTSIKIRVRFRPGFDPAPTVGDLRTRLTDEIRGDEENSRLRRSLLEAAMPETAPERLDWKIDEAYIQKNIPLIKDTLSMFQDKQEKFPDVPENGSATEK